MVKIPQNKNPEWAKELFWKLVYLGVMGLVNLFAKVWSVLLYLVQQAVVHHLSTLSSASALHLDT